MERPKTFRGGVLGTVKENKLQNNHARIGRGGGGVSLNIYLH